MVRLPMNLYSIGAFVLGTALLMAVLLLSGLHTVFDISSAITAYRIGQIALLAALPTIVIQLYRTVKDYIRKML